ncbi:hypothetical protein HQ865_05755 [Mucilaginibacter mali]|uniref:Addiction module component n=1 Tax=Mucilaginibacter mali TaxID=2740462 RepID=A0A7D4UCF8_9SPHI|nr:hypothetical protein [Mucilaginibacter mali]QKJ29279.1 hypothetical protein HQ865_05755 [Mucilaginibacter mali]
MTTLTMREKLITYLAEAEDSKVNAMYILLEKEIENVTDQFILTDEQFEILEKEHELHISGKSKSYTREEADQIIRGLRSF